MNDQRVLVAVPTLNEAENILELLLGLRISLPDAELLVIDDSSSDGTDLLVMNFASTDTKTSLITRPNKQGVGSAHKLAFEQASLKGVDILVTLDADLTHNPKDIPRLLNHIGNFDLVVGSRFLPDGGLENWTPLRKLLTHVGHFATRKLLGIPYDATGSLRAYRLSCVFSILEKQNLSDGYTWFYESLSVLAKSGLSVCEIPITLSARTYGSSKMKLNDVIFGALNLFKFRFSVLNSIQPSYEK
jgi:dolichol-phosphate mannosyltransferase